MNTAWTFRLGALIALAALLAGCAPPDRERAAQAGKENTRMEQMPQTPVHAPEGKEIATFAGGCFWCVEAIFIDLKGVEKVESGYSGGHAANPTYREVCNGDTGHAEALQITYDPKEVSYRDLLRIFFTTHDPTTLNRQGADEGTQYRSAVFYHSEEQKRAAQEVIKEIEAERLWNAPIVTEVTAFTNFYKAEDYHQNYYAQNATEPYCQAVIAPKVAKFRAKYREKLKR